jgi:type I restriction enzyme R subunit
MIEEYNNGSRNVEDLFDALVKLTQSLSAEQQRHVRENMSEEELVVFDILLKPAPELTTEERGEVKKVVRVLLDKLKKLLVLDWRQRASARSQVRIAIEDELDSGLPRAFTKDLYQQKCSALFEHMYEKYPQREMGVYAHTS